MRKFFLLILFFLIITTNLFSQGRDPFFSKIEGTWQRVYVIKEDSVVETLKMHWLFLSTFEIAIELSSTKGNSKELDKEKEFFSSEDDDENFEGWCVANADNYYIFCVTGKEDRDHNKVTMTGINKWGTLNLSYELKDGKLIRKREINITNADHPRHYKSEDIFTRL